MKNIILTWNLSKNTVHKFITHLLIIIIAVILGGIRAAFA